VGANTLRFTLAACPDFVVIGTSTQQADVSLQRCRPWYVRRWPPSQFERGMACREGLQEAGSFSHTSVVFTPLAENQPELDASQPLRL